MSYCESIKKQSGILYAKVVKAGGVSLVKMNGNLVSYTAHGVEQ